MTRPGPKSGSIIPTVRYTQYEPNPMGFITAKSMERPNTLIRSYLIVLITILQVQIMKGIK